jgi:hypothetical protein
MLVQLCIELVWCWISLKPRIYCSFESFLRDDWNKSSILVASSPNPFGPLCYFQSLAAKLDNLIHPLLLFSIFRSWHVHLCKVALVWCIFIILYISLSLIQIINHFFSNENDQQLLPFFISRKWPRFNAHFKEQSHV